MEEWIFRSTSNSNWVFYICYFNLLIIALLNQAFPKKINYILNILSIFKNLKTSMSKHFIIDPFNFGSFLIISSSLSLFFYQFFIEFIDSSFNQNDFIYIFLLISITLISRFLLVKSIFSIFSKIDDIDSYLAKNQYQNILLCVSILILIFINEYSFINKQLIIGCFISVFLVWISFTFLLFYRYIKNRENEFLYLIFYICAVKISPWLWIYHSIYETRIKFLQL